MSGRGAAIMFSVRELASVEKGLFCYGTAPSVADIFLVSQLGNARRNTADVSGSKRLLEAEAACMKIPAFAASEPDR
jgi:maleylpyruvate isomerase